MLATKLIQNRWKAAGMMATGVVLTMVACESRLPQEATQEQQTILDPQPILDQRPDKEGGVLVLVPTQREGERLREVPRVVLDRLQPTQRNAMTILDQEYPPLLRQAGIEGTIGLRVHVTDGGKADQVEVVRSSGHDALDLAAVRVAKRMAWGHDGAGKTTDYWTTTSITFKNNAQEVRMRVPGREPVRAEGITLPKRIDPDGDPHFTPFTKRPEVRNREVLQDLLRRNYPPLLRDAGVGGTVFAWALIDETGNVIKTKLKESSGHDALDQAGLKVVEAMKWVPAEHNGTPVNVWIQLPVVFKTQ